MFLIFISYLIIGIKFILVNIHDKEELVTHGTWNRILKKHKDLNFTKSPLKSLHSNGSILYFVSLKWNLVVKSPLLKKASWLKWT